MMIGIPASMPVGAGPMKKLPPSKLNIAACDIITLSELWANIDGNMLPVRRHRYEYIMPVIIPKMHIEIIPTMGNPL